MLPTNIIFVKKKITNHDKKKLSIEKYIIKIKTQ